MPIINKLLLSLIFSLTMLYASEYKVETTKSTVEFKIRHLLISSVRGTFNKFKGSYEYDPIKKAISSLEGVVQVSSIDTNDASRDQYLLSKDFFNTDKFPEMTLKLLKSEDEETMVRLKIKDVTKEIAFTITPLSENPAHLELNAQISRKNFNLLFNSLVETTAIAVGDEVKIKLNILGRQIQ